MREIASSFVVWGCISAAIGASWGCGSEAPSARASTSSEVESAQGTPATGSSAPSAPPSATATGQDSPARDGVETPTALQNPAEPAEPSPSEGGGQQAPEQPPAATGDEPENAGVPEVPPAPQFPVSAGTPTLYLAGDSTVQTYGAAQAPQQGWGQRIAEFFTADVRFVNKAIGGRSSKSFIDEGRLDEIIAVLEPGDYLFAQWGINDRYRSDPTRFTDPATTFRQYLQQYIDAARSKNAIPVLVTPTPRLDFTDGEFHNGFVGYCDAIKAVGAATETRVIDLQTKGLAYYTSLGFDAVVADVVLPPMDVLHFQANGALQMARLVAEGVKESDLPIAKFVK